MGNSLYLVLHIIIKHEVLAPITPDGNKFPPARLSSCSDLQGLETSMQKRGDSSPHETLSPLLRQRLGVSTTSESVHFSLHGAASGEVAMSAWHRSSPVKPWESYGKFAVSGAAYNY